MSKFLLSALDEDVSALVRRSARIVPAPRGARGRVLAGVEAAVLSGSAMPSGGAEGSTRPPAAGRTMERAVALATGLVVGGALGAGVMYRHLRPAADTVVAPPPSPPTVATAAVEPPLAPAPLIRPPTAPTGEPPARFRRDMAGPPSRPSAPVAASAATTSDRLAEERSLLDAARGAVEREDGAGALTATEEHARKYPNGILAQEREAIAVRALLLLGRNAEARARVSRFRATFPDSMLLPTLEASVEAASAP